MSQTFLDICRHRKLFGPEKHHICGEVEIKKICLFRSGSICKIYVCMWIGTH